LSDKAEERRQPDMSTSLPGVDAFQRQIGSAQDGCEITTGGCQATISGCTNLQYVSKSPFLSLPADIIVGSEQRSGYVVWVEGEDTVVVAACDPDYLDVRKQIPGLQSVERSYASSSAAPTQ
jgi:hypothetical protein